MKLRPYQIDAVDSIGGTSSNVIIKMPTGSGKTLVAFEFCLRRLAKNHRPAGKHNKAALFLVPTKDLVSQRWLGGTYNVEQYCGGLRCPRAGFDILVSTPQAFLQTRTDSNWLGWQSFFACIFDEVHHVLKEHPYRKLAHSIRAWESLHPGDRVQVIGMSASLTYAVEDQAVQDALNALCQDLAITKMICPSAKDLEDGGYSPKDDSIQTIHKPWRVPEGVIPETKRRPHNIHQQFMSRANQVGGEKLTEFACKVYNCVISFEQEFQHFVNDQDNVTDDFESPLSNPKLSSWESYAHQMRKRSVVGSSVHTFYINIEVWYVALRMLVISWEEEVDLVQQWLSMNGSLSVEGYYSPRLAACLHAVSMHSKNDDSTSSDNKLKHLVKTILHERKTKGVQMRCIVFVQQRISAYVLSSYLNNHPELADYGIHSGYVAARGSKITPSIKVSDVAESIQRFRNGSINLIVTTSVIEEGFDVPEANCVISYDHIKDAVELSQRFGRARAMDSSLHLLSERKDRPLVALKDVKKRQDSIITSFCPSRDDHSTSSRSIQSQQDRERAAYELLEDLDRCNHSPLAVLNTYSSKTKAVIREDIVKRDGSMFHCSLIYASRSCNITGSGSGNTKKEAKRNSAFVILDQLRNIKSPYN